MENFWPWIYTFATYRTSPSGGEPFINISNGLRRGIHHQGRDGWRGCLRGKEEGVSKMMGEKMNTGKSLSSC